MAIELGITEFNDNEYIPDFSEAEIYHTNCDTSKYQKISIDSPLPKKTYFALKCKCGLEVTFDRFGEAELIMSKCAIGGPEATLPDDSYASNTEGPIVVKKL